MSKHYVQIDCPNCCEKLHVVYVTDSCKTKEFEKIPDIKEEPEDVIGSLTRELDKESISDKIDRMEKIIMKKFEEPSKEILKD